MGDELPVGPYRYGLPGTHRQGGPPTGKNGDIGGTEKTLAGDPFQGGRIPIQTSQQAAANLHVGDAGQKHPWHQLGGQGPPLGTPYAPKPAGTAMAPHPLEPGAGHNPTHGEPKQIDGLIGAKAVLDPISQPLRQHLKGREAQTMGQMGDPQVRTPSRQPSFQPAKQFGAIPQSVHENQGRRLRAPHHLGLVIRATLKDRHPAIDLLHQEQPGNLVGKGHRRETELRHGLGLHDLPVDFVCVSERNKTHK